MNNNKQANNKQVASAPQKSNAQKPNKVKTKSSAKTVQLDQGLLSGKSKVSKLNGWPLIRQLVGKENERSLRFLVSPGDGAPISGFPDAVYTDSGILHLKTSDTIAMPSVFTEDTWNLTLLHFPSPDLPLIAYATPGSAELLFYGTTPTSVDALQSLEYSESTNEYRPSGLITSSTTWCMAYTFPTFKPEYVKGVDNGSSLERTPGFISPAANSAFIHGSPTHTIALGSTIDTEVRSFRCLGSSLTTHLVADAFSNRGVVYSKKLQHLVPETTQNYLINAVAPAGGTRQYIGTARSNVVSDLPATLADFVANSPYYLGEAADGSYTVSEYNPNGVTITSPVQQRSVLAFPTTDILYTASLNAIITSSTSYGEAVFPVSNLVDYNFTPTITVYRGISKLASVNVKVSMGCEIAALPESPYAAIIHETPELNVVYAEVMEALMRHINPGYPASYNDFFTELKKIGKTALEVFQQVAPFMKLISKMA
jgi:hypothetical protein